MAWKLAGKYRGKNIGAGFCLESLFMFSIFACVVSVKSFEATATVTSLAAVILTTQGTPKLMRERWEGERGTPRRFVRFAPSHIRGRLNRVMLLHKVRSYSCQLECFRNRSWRAWSHSPWLYTFGKDFLQSVWTVKETQNLWRMWMSPQPGQAARNLDLQLHARPRQYWAANKNSARIQLFLLNACPIKYERQLFLVLSISCTVWRELTATFANRSFVACTLITLRTIESLATLRATRNLWTPMR